MLERHHLAILLAVEQYGSLTAAAEQLHLTQSALSHSMRKLEQQLGTLLWRREGRQLRPTQAGRYLLGVARRVLPQLGRAEQQLLQFAQGQRGTLGICMECHLCYRWLLKVAEPFLQAWPHVEVGVRQQFQSGGTRAMFHADIDLLVTPGPRRRYCLHFQPVVDYAQVLATAAGHDLAGRSCIPGQYLALETLIASPVPIAPLNLYTQRLLRAG